MLRGPIIAPHNDALHQTPLNWTKLNWNNTTLCVLAIEAPFDKRTTFSEYFQKNGIQDAKHLTLNNIVLETWYP